MSAAKRRIRESFTLIELLVVIAIIAVLASMRPENTVGTGNFGYDATMTAANGQWTRIPGD